MKCEQRVFELLL